MDGVFNNSSSRIEVRSNFYISKLVKVEDTDQLLASLFSVAGIIQTFIRFIESLVKDYRKSDRRLRKERLKTRQSEQALYERECEIEKLNEKNQEQLQIMLQFEQDHLRLKEDHAHSLVVIQSLEADNKELLDTVRSFNKDKQEMKSEFQHKIDAQKDELSRLGQQCVQMRDKL